MPGAVATTTVTFAGAAVFTAPAIVAFTAAALGNAAIAFGIGAISKAMQGKPDSSSLSGSSPGRTRTTRAAVSPRKVVYGYTRVAGTETFRYFTHNNGAFHQVITLTGHPIESFDRYFVNDEEVFLDAKGKPTSGSWNDSGLNPRIRIVGGTGTLAGDAAFNAAMQENLPGIWTPDHRQTGCAKIYVVGAVNNFPVGPPNVTVVMKGKNDIFDPRTSTTGWTDNAANCTRDYLVDPLLGVGEPASAINDTAWIAEANICDEAVALKAGGTEERYTINGQFDKSVADQTVLSRMLSASAGMLTHQGGEYTLYTGAYRPPTITYDENQVVGPVDFQPLIGDDELFNRVKGTFINPNDFWQEVPFSSVTNATYLAEDQNEKLWKPGDVFYPFTDSDPRCQRLAKIDLERVRQQGTEALSFNLQGMRVQLGDVVNRIHATRGWDNQPCEVKEWAFVDFGKKGAPRIGVEMVLRETAPEVYAWNLGEENTIDPSPNTNFPNPFAVEVPGNFAVSSGNAGLVLSQDGSVLVYLHATWLAPTNSFTEYFETQFKLSSESIWANGPNVISNNEVFLGPVQGGVSYDARARSVNTFGRPSAWASIELHVVVGKTADPTDVTTFTFTEQPDGTRLYSWVHDNIPADVRVGGGYQIRYFVGTTTSWEAMTDLNTQGLLQFSPYESNDLAAGTYTFAIKAVDSSKNDSASAKFISSVSLNNPRIGEALIVRNESSLSFPGTLVDCSLTGGVLQADADGEGWSDLPTTWSALGPSWHELILNKTPITYTTLELDLGSDVNMTPLVSVAGVGTPTITMQTGTDADGSVTGAFGVLDTKIIRYIKIKVSMAATDPLITEISTIIDSPSKKEFFDDLNTATETAVWFNSIVPGHFQIGSKGEIRKITQASVRAIQNVGAGYTWELINKNSTVNSEVAAEFKIYNSSGVLTDATVDVELRGAKK